MGVFEIMEAMERCNDYTGIACVDGSCPIANMEEYIERGMDVIRKCEDCFYYKGCGDCCFSGTEFCDKTRKDGIA